MRRVQQILRNAHYAGVVSYLGDRIDVEPEWTPIVDSRTWSDASEMRDGRKREGAWSTTTKHLLSGLMTCGVCGARMLARPDYRRGPDGERVTRPAYACQQGWCTQILAADIEPFVEGLVLARLGDKRIARALRSVPDAAPLKAEADALRRRRDNVLDLLAEGVLDKRRARQQAGDLTTKIEALTAKVAAMRKESPLTDLALARSIPTKWAKLSTLDQRRVIGEIGLRVTINRAKPGRRPLGADGLPVVDLRRVEIDWITD